MDSRPLRNLLDRLRRTAAAPGDGLSDAELLLRFVRRRDEAAFELLVWRHGPMVLSVCRRVLRDPHAAEDAFQATFLALARKAGSIAHGGAVAPWLYRVALRAALRARATAAKRAARPLPADLPAPDAGGRAEDDWRPILDEEINRLPERYRGPVVLCHLQGHTLAEAARQLGCPRGTVAVRLVRARQRLRARLARRGVALAAVLATVLAAESGVSAALVKEAVRAAVGYALGGAAGALSPSVLTLTEGVLRAMFLSKIKLVAAALLATALAGAGAAWVISYRAEAGEPSAAGTAAQAAPPADAPPASRNAADRQAEDKRADPERARKEQEKRLEQAQKLWLQAESEVVELEEAWLKQFVEARLRVLDLRDELKSKERERDNAPRGPNPPEDATLQTLKADRKRAEEDLFVAKASAKENDPTIQRLAKKLEELDARVHSRLGELEKEAAEKTRKRDEDFTKLLHVLRRDLVVAEEKLAALQRRQERHRDQARRDVEERAQRVRQLQQALDEGEPAVPPAGRSAADLEKKLDQVLRELSELRRSVRSLEEKRPEAP
jgi:RNA polymerase sigma factor (sigma-70 family)